MMPCPELTSVEFKPGTVEELRVQLNALQIEMNLKVNRKDFFKAFLWVIDKEVMVT